MILALAKRMRVERWIMIESPSMCPIFTEIDHRVPLLYSWSADWEYGTNENDTTPPCFQGARDEKETIDKSRPRRRGRMLAHVQTLFTYYHASHIYVIHDRKLYKKIDNHNPSPETIKEATRSGFKLHMYYVLWLRPTEQYFGLRTPSPSTAYRQ